MKRYPFLTHLKENHRKATSGRWFEDTICRLGSDSREIVRRSLTPTWRDRAESCVWTVGLKTFSASSLAVYCSWPFQDSVMPTQKAAELKPNPNCTMKEKSPQARHGLLEGFGT